MEAKICLIFLITANMKMHIASFGPMRLALLDDDCMTCFDIYRHRYYQINAKVTPCLGIAASHRQLIPVNIRQRYCISCISVS